LVPGCGGAGFFFCPGCGCVAFYRAKKRDSDGRQRVAVNVRLSEPGTVADIPIDHFDGLDKFEDLPRDGRCGRLRAARSLEARRGRGPARALPQRDCR